MKRAEEKIRWAETSMRCGWLVHLLFLTDAYLTGGPGHIHNDDKINAAEAEMIRKMMTRTRRKNEVSAGGQQLSWLKWRDIENESTVGDTHTHTRLVFPAQLFHWKTVDVVTLNSLLHSTVSSCLLKYQNKEKKREWKRNSLALAVSCLSECRDSLIVPGKPVEKPWTSLSR